MKSLRTKILLRLKEVGIKIHKGEIEKFAQREGYLGETSGRALRKLKEDGMIEGDKGYYWYIPSKYEIYHLGKLKAL